MNIEVTWVSVVAFVGGPTVVGSLIAAGVAARWFRPMIREEIINYEGLASTVQSREQAAAKVVLEAVQRTDGEVAKALASVGTELREPLAKLVQESTRTLTALTDTVGAANMRSEQRHTATAELLQNKTLAIEALTAAQRQTTERIDALLLEVRRPAWPDTDNAEDLQVARRLRARRRTPKK